MSTSDPWTKRVQSRAEALRGLKPALLTRRAIVGFPALVGLSLKAERVVQGSFVNDAFPSGHAVRDQKALAAARRQIKIPVVIMGGGMAGLSAAWRLHKRGF